MALNFSLPTPKMKAELTPEEEARLRRRQRQIFKGSVTLIGLLALIAVLSLIVRPLWADITEIKGEIETNQGLLARLEAKQKSLAAAETAYKQINSKENVIKEAMPNYSDIPMVMRILEKLATEVDQETGPYLAINSMGVSAMPDDDPYTADQNDTGLQDQMAEITITMSADYTAVRDYVDKLKALRHNFFINRITFSADDDDSSILNVSLIIRYYYYN